MKTVTVSASRTYDVKIGSGLLSTLGREVTMLGDAKQVCLVSDSNVWPLFGEAAKRNLESYGIAVFPFLIPAGEDSKNGTMLLKLLNFLAESGLTRQDILVALGGGVVGDLSGFAASCYLRGIRFIQVPTTLLAAVDSSVGGKTAIDLPAGKNLAGSFWQPSLVLCDTDTLKTLPMEVFRDGCAEVIKYGVLYDPELFASLEVTGSRFDTESVVARCVQLKRDAVERDEFDTGERMKLNLGHTIGHGVEAGSHYTISHGQAVAIGISIVSRAIHCRDAERIVALLEKFGLPTNTLFQADVLYGYTLSDKKRLGQNIRLVVPVAIGDCVIHTMPVSRLRSFIESGL